MTQASHQQLLDGHSSAPEQAITLRAGALDVLYDNGSIRQIKLNGEPVIHQIYATVRDHNWGTVPGIMYDFELVKGDDNFSITYRMHHQQGEIDFVWNASIVGTADSKISFSFDGIANSSFKRNRIGFCVLHPMTLAGQDCSVKSVDGTYTQGQFPELIAPHQPFFDIRSIEHRVKDDIVATVLMEGDSFEMEDQRNWIDASYKTYCTPLGLPFPVTVDAGEHISQKITLSLTGNIPEKETVSEKLIIIIGDTSKQLPTIGIGLPSHGEKPSQKDIQRLKALNLAHLRADIHLSQNNASEQLSYAWDYAQQLDTSLEIAVFVSDKAEQELAFFADSLKSASMNISRIILFHENEKSTSRKWVELAKSILSETDIPIGAGTNAFFAELNRERPPADLLDFVSYSLNPQVHAFDNLSLVETLQVHRETVKTARAFSEDAKIVISPVTFKMRFNPNATGRDSALSPDELPAQVDPRQMSLFGATWTLGSIKYLAESAVDALTYYETTGWRGLMEIESGSPLQEKFSSIAGTVFPLYFVFKALADFRAGNVQMSFSTLAQKVESLLLQKDTQTRLILANLTAVTQHVSLETEAEYHLRLLNQDTVEDAMLNPDSFWEHTRKMTVSAIELAPYALAILDKVGTDD
ncbi:MAG: hypothetical protein Phog2KO_19060 [Phototrophicaceae bacterium]